MELDLSKHSVIARSYKMEGIKNKIAQHFANDVSYITLSAAKYNNWWVYNGSILKAEYMVVFDTGKYHFIKGDCDFRYPNAKATLDHSHIVNPDIID